MTSLDLVPTVLAAVAANPSASAHFDGVSLLPFLTGQATGQPHPRLYWRMNRWAALREADWKIVRKSNPGAQAQWQLYDLAHDLSEQQDLAEEQPQRRDELIRAWLQLDAQMEAPRW